MKGTHRPERGWSRAQELLQEAVAILGKAIRELHQNPPAQPSDDHLTADLARVAAVLAGEAAGASNGTPETPPRWQRILDALVDFDAYLLLALLGEEEAEVLELGGEALRAAPGQILDPGGLALREALEEGRPVVAYRTTDSSEPPCLRDFPARLAIPAVDALLGGGLVVLRRGLPFSAAEANTTACLSLSLSPHIDRHYLARAARGDSEEQRALRCEAPTLVSTEASEEGEPGNGRPSAPVSLGVSHEHQLCEAARSATLTLKHAGMPLGADYSERLSQSLSARSGDATGLIGAGLCRCPARPHCPLLQRLDRLATLGQMVASVSHELNNALTAVMGFTELLVADEVPPSLRETADQVQQQSERAARMVRDLLAFSRADPAEREPVDLNEVVRRTAALRERELQVQNMIMQLRLAPSLPPVLADRGQIQQVILNLLLNAEQAMVAGRDKGTVCLSTAYRPAEDQVVLCVADDGPGIPEQEQARIFEPFHTTKVQQGGTGLGLSVCLAIIAQHNGRIYCESSAGEGARFFIELPASGSRQPSQDPSPDPAGQVSPASGAVLLVDDESAILELMHKVLSGEGFEVHVAETGRQALDLLGGHSYDLIISDLRMPDVNGWMLYQHILRRHPEMSQRIIFTTGDMAATEEGGLLKEAGCPCLAKPFTSKELLALTRQVIRGEAEPR